MTICTTVSYTHLDVYKRQGYRIGLASSKPAKSCERILEHFGILDMFDEVVGAKFDGRIDTKEEVLNEVMRRWSDIPDVYKRQVYKRVP